MISLSRVRRHRPSVEAGTDGRGWVVDEEVAPDPGHGAGPGALTVVRPDDDLLDARSDGSDFPAPLSAGEISVAALGTLRMRLAAAAWGCAAAGLGVAAVSSRSARWIVMCGLAASAAWTGLVAAAARPIPRGARPMRCDEGERVTPDDGSSSPSQLPFVSVVVPARDEAGVLPGLLADLVGQDHREPDGSPRYDVTLIDDRSTDGTHETFEAARSLGLPVARVVRRPPGVPDGKGAALREVPAEAYRGEILVVLDADARLDSSFLRVAATHVVEGRLALTARRRILGAGLTGWARVQDDEQAVDGLLQRGREAIGGCPEFRGDGVVIARDLLARAGGWAVDALTEDLDLSTRLAASGLLVSVPTDLIVRETPVLGAADFWAQRMRWAEGSLRRYLRHGPRVVRSAVLPRRARLDFVAYAAQLTFPPLLAGAIAGGVLRRRPAIPVVLLAAYGLGGLLVACRALLTTDRSSGPRRSVARRALGVTLFGGTWLAVVPVAFVRLVVRRGAPVYAKTPHRPLPEPPTSRACPAACSPMACLPSAPG